MIRKGEMDDMKKTIRNLMAICFALVLVAGVLPMYAQALSESDTGTISIAGLDEEVEIAVYKLMEVNYDDTADQPVDPAFVWVSAVASWVETNYPAYIDASTGAVTEEFAQLSSDTTGYGTDLATFYDKMAKAIRAGDVTVAVAATATGNGNIEDLTMGNYLVLIENGMKIYRPSTVNLIPVWDEAEGKWVMSTANVVIKSSDPSVKKEMAIADAATDANDVKVGDTVDYTVTADIPVYPANALAKGYQIGDDLPDGITLDATSMLLLRWSTLQLSMRTLCWVRVATPIPHIWTTTITPTATQPGRKRRLTVPRSTPLALR